MAALYWLEGNEYGSEGKLAEINGRCSLVSLIFE